MKTMIKAALASTMLIVATAAHAGPVVGGFDTSTLPTCDDCYSGATTLGFVVSFFGQTYTDAYVSNNGYITFGSGQGAYTPTGLTANYMGNPIIAAFYADVDTRGAGTVTYGSGVYNGRQAFGVTWNDVGYYYAASDKLNDFQEILVSRPDLGVGDFNIVFNYDQVQ